MDISQKLLDELVGEVEKRNRELNAHAVVHSDMLVKFVSSSTGMPKDSVRTAIRILLDCHKLLSIEIVAEDEKRRVERVDGYVVADLPVVRNLNTFFQDLLVKAYETQFHKRMGSAQIKKELFPVIKSLNSTELGQIFNKTVMLGEYERLLEIEWQQYAPEWQEQKLAETALRYGFRYKPKVPVKITSEESATEPSGPVQAEGGAAFSDLRSQRAVDSPDYDSYAQNEEQYPLQRILNIYGIDFFLKVKLRKYQFEYLRKAVDNRQINKKNDLVRMKEMLGKVKDSLYRGTDPVLKGYEKEIYALERSISHAIYFSS